ncbi:MAG TPA: helix-turn-helix domain-containing protein [Acidimicrobiales bacterium]|jgi:AcrR family transcriptional regulator|nr:helix-turn-helix domain-containing protein [Acidimicrobiales bacterium]
MSAEPTRRSQRHHIREAARRDHLEQESEPPLGTRERILETATRLFTDQGYDGTSLREIADELGFTKAALYYHFKSKDEILVALVEPMDEMLHEFLDRLEGATDATEWVDALEWAVDQWFERLDFFRMIVRNRASLAAHQAAREAFSDHEEAHARLERTVRQMSSDLGEQVRMVAALAAVTGFDDWAPTLMVETDPVVLREELLGVVRQILGVRPRPRRSSA